MTNMKKYPIVGRSDIVRALLTLSLTLAWAQSVDAQRVPRVDAVFARLGLPVSTLDGLEPAELAEVCQGTDCRVDYATQSDVVCRAVAVDIALRRRAEQIRAGGSAQVVTRVQCSRGMFAVFQTTARRAVIGHRDAVGNTGQREIPL